MDRQQKAADEAMKKPAWADSYAGVQRERDRLKALNKELVEALENLMCRLDDHFGGPGRSYDWKEQELARAALEKAKGE
jgi:hypothetical protein